MPSRRVIFALSFLVMLFMAFAVADEKLTPEQVIARHIAAIGPADQLKTMEYLEVSGTAQIRGDRTLPITGTVELISERDKVKFSTKLPANDYPGEQFVSDGKNVKIAQISPGKRSGVGEFIWRAPAIVGDGLLGGVLSADWPLYDAKAKNAKLEYKGTANVNGRTAHLVVYKPKKGPGELEVRLYFDTESFQHVRTVYRLISRDMTAPEMGGRYAQPGERVDTTFELQEDFKDFTRLGAFTFPLTSEIRFSSEFMKPWICELKYDTINKQKVR